MINNPPNRELLTDVSGVRPAWKEWFDQVFLACFSVFESGETSKRPTKLLWVGRQYFDTTIGKPIWYDGTNWVDATGATV